MEKGELFCFCHSQNASSTRYWPGLWQILATPKLYVKDFFCNLVEENLHWKDFSNDDLVCKLSSTSSRKDPVQVRAWEQATRLSRFGVFVAVMLEKEALLTKQRTNAFPSAHAGCWHCCVVSVAWKTRDRNFLLIFVLLFYFFRPLTYVSRFLWDEKQR